MSQSGVNIGSKLSELSHDLGARMHQVESKFIESFRTYEKLIKAGIITGYTELYRVDIQERFANEDVHEIRILKTWFPEDTFFEDGLRHAMEAKKKVHLFLCDPSSNLLQIRSRGAGVEMDEGKRRVLKAINICGCETSAWKPAEQTQQLIADIREKVGMRKVFFFVSGGVDSTVAFTLCSKALGAEHVEGVFVDTGLMRDVDVEDINFLKRSQ